MKISGISKYFGAPLYIKYHLLLPISVLSKKSTMYYFPFGEIYYTSKCME